jgi:hypothetical protein
MNWGDFPVPDQIHYAETLIVAPISGQMGGGQSLNFSLANVTMPWAGTLTTSCYHTGSVGTAAVIAISCWPYGTQPTQYYAGSQLESFPYGGYTNCPYMAQWTGLAKGQVVNMGIQVQCNIASQPWTCDRIDGSLRMFRD